MECERLNSLSGKAQAAYLEMPSDNDAGQGVNALKIG